MRGRVAFTDQDGGSLPDQGSDHLRLSMAQIVLSVTSAPTVNGVILESGGRAVEAPAGDGSLTSAPLTHDDYRTLIHTETEAGRTDN